MHTACTSPPLTPLLSQVSLHAFSLAHWTAQPQHGRAGYARMLRSLGDLARAEKLHLFTRAVPVAGSPVHLQACHACLPAWQLGFVGHPVLGDEMYGSPPLQQLRELCRLDTAPEGPLASLPVAWLPERPFALHSWKLRFAGRAAEPEGLAASSRGSGGSADGGSCRQVTHAYEVQPPWAV